MYNHGFMWSKSENLMKVHHYHVWSQVAIVHTLRVTLVDIITVFLYQIYWEENEQRLQDVFIGT